MKIKTKNIFLFSLCLFLAHKFLFASETLPPLPDTDVTELPPLPDLPPLPGEELLDISHLKLLVKNDPQKVLKILAERSLPGEAEDLFQVVAMAQKAIGKNIASEYNFAVMDFLLGRSEQALKNLQPVLKVLETSKSDSNRSKIRHARCLHLMSLIKHSLGHEKEATNTLQQARNKLPPRPMDTNIHPFSDLPPLPGTHEYQTNGLYYLKHELASIEFTNARFKIISGQIAEATGILKMIRGSHSDLFDFLQDDFLPLPPVYLRLNTLNLSDPVLSQSKSIPLRFNSSEKLIPETTDDIGSQRLSFLFLASRIAKNSGNYEDAEKFLEEAVAISLLNYHMGISYNISLEWVTFPSVPESLGTYYSNLDYALLEYFETLDLLGKHEFARSEIMTSSYFERKKIVWALALRLYKLGKIKECVDFVPKYFFRFDSDPALPNLPPTHSGKKGKLELSKLPKLNYGESSKYWTPQWDSPFPNDIIAGFFLMVDDYDRALKHFSLAIDSERKKLGKNWKYQTAYDRLVTWTQDEKDLNLKEKGIEFKKLSQLKVSESLIGECIKLGDQFYERRNFDEARENFRKALELIDARSPKNEFLLRSNILRRIGKCYAQKNEFKSAKVKYQDALRIVRDLNKNDSNESIILICNLQSDLIKTCNRLEKYDESLFHLEELLSMREKTTLRDEHFDLKFNEIYEKFAGVYNAQKKYGESIRNYNLAIEEFCKWLEIDRTELIAFLKKPNPQLEREWQIRYLFRMCGEVYARNNLDNEAIEYFRLAQRENPFGDLANQYFLEGNFGKAKLLWEQAIQRQETLSASDQRSLAQSYLVLGNDDEAFKIYEKLIEIYKGNQKDKWKFETPYDLMVGDLCWIDTVFDDTDLDQRRLIPWLEQSFKLHLENNNLADKVGNLGRIHIRLGNYREALQQLENLPDGYGNYYNFILSIPEKDRNEKKLNELDAIALKFFKEKFLKQKKLLGELWEFESAYDELAESYVQLKNNEDHNASIKESFTRRALNYRQKALQEYIQEFGQVHETVAQIYEFIGAKQVGLKQFDDAKRNFDKVIEIKSLLGLDSLKIAEYHQTAGNTFDQAGEYEKVVYFYEKALSIYRGHLETSDSNITNCMNTLANAYGDWGKTDQAIDLYKQIVTLYKEKKELKKADQEVLWMVQYNLGHQSERDLEDYKSAIEHYSESLKIVTKVLGEDHVRFSDICFRLGGCYLYLGNREMARNYFLKFIEFSKGKRHLILAEHGLKFESDEQASFKIFMESGHEFFNEKMYEEAIDFYKIALESGDSETAQSTASLLSDIGECYLNLDNKTFALQYYQKALEARQKADPKQDNWLAEIYLKLGRCSNGEIAKEYVQQALSIYTQLHGEESHEVAVCYQRLGENAREDKAIYYYDQALTIFTELYGYESHEVASCYLSMGKTQNALDIFVEIHGQDHESVARCYRLLGYEFMEKNQSIIAKECFQKSLDINLKNKDQEIELSKNYHYLGLWHYTQMEFKEALNYFEKQHSAELKFLGALNKDTIESKAYIFLCNSLLGRKSTAERLANEVLEEHVKYVASRLNYLGPSARLNFMKEESSLQFLFPFVSTENLGEKILQLKGLVLDSVLEDENLAQNSQSSEVKNLLIERTALQRSLRFVQSDPTAFEAKALEVQNKLDELNAKLGGLVDVKSREALNVSLEQVAQKIPINTALIEFIEFEEQDLLDLEKDSKARFGAIIILPTNSVDPDSTAPKPIKITLAYKEEVEEHLSAFLNWTSSKNKIYPRNALPELHRLLIKPVITTLPKEIDSLILSPDGMLSFLPFHALHENPDAPFLSEKFSLFQVTSGRDLLKEFEPNDSKKVVLFGNPEFQNSNAHSADDDLTLASLDPRAESFRDLSFASLPYSQAEVGLLNQLFQKKYQPTAFIGASAKESTLRELNNPRILHLATHGFFIDNPEKISDHSGQSRFFGINKDENSIPNNPMRRAGLALSGAQSTFDAWSKNQRTVSENDGIFTAEEAAMLDLQGTWLTTLSACETGSGSTQAGEGVFGLRRAFYQAGTQNLLLTLWPVNDYRTVDFMTAFYEEALRTENAPRALAKVQRDFLVNFRKKRSLSQAIKYFAPFALTFRGPLPE